VPRGTWLSSPQNKNKNLLYYFLVGIILR